MRRHYVFVFLSFVLLLSGMRAAMAEDTPKILKWKDLTGKVTVQDPAAHLSAQQKEEIAIIEDYRYRVEVSSDPVSAAEKKKYEQHRAALKAQGIAVDQLLKEREAFQQTRRQEMKAPVAALHGQSIRLAGYLLPLEYDKGGVSSEFLLVPWVGACIHTPPPPPNQIVYIKLSRPYAVDTLFSPVEVRGIMRVEPSTNALMLVDGTGNINANYQIQEGEIKAFKAQ